MPEEAEQLAARIVTLGGPQARGCYDVLLSILRKLGRDPDLHERVALEMIAAAGVSAPGSFELLLNELQTRYPSETDLHQFIARGKRKTSLKLGRPFSHR